MLSPISPHTHYLARLHAERAHLTWQLRGLDEATLTQPEIIPDHTIKDLLAHIAFYDGFRTEQIALVHHGRITDLHEFPTNTDLDAFNADLLARHKPLPLNQVIANLQQERDNYLAQIAQLDTAELQRPFTTPSGQTTTLAHWLPWRYEHDASHSADIQQWRTASDPTLLRQPTPKPLLIAMLHHSRHAFLALRDLIPNAEWSSKPVCGVWSFQDLLGHITDWEKVGVDGLRQLAAGHLPEFNYTIGDFDAFNNPNAAARAHQTWEEVVHDHTATRAELLDLLAQTSTDQLQRPFTAPWGSPITGAVWMLVWIGHELEHAIDIRAALKLTDWPPHFTEHPK